MTSLFPYPIFLCSQTFDRYDSDNQRCSRAVTPILPVPASTGNCGFSLRHIPFSKKDGQQEMRHSSKHTTDGARSYAPSVPPSTLDPVGPWALPRGAFSIVTAVRVNPVAGMGTWTILGSLPL
jgi:hypothetical protein